MLYLGINYYESEIMKKNQQISSLNVELYHASNELEQTNNQIDALNQQVEQLYSVAIDEMELIEPIKYTDKKVYLTLYKEIVTYAPDPPETIYDYTTDEEFELICRVIEAEAGVGELEDKIHVANVIINRYYDDNFPKTWSGILKQKSENGVYQFSSVGNLSYKNVKISESTRIALEYAFLFSDEETKDATYFCLKNEGWHSDNLDFVFKDNYHYFFKEKKQNE